jgi:hypothetical protein
LPESLREHEMQVQDSATRQRPMTVAAPEELCVHALKAKWGQRSEW